MGSGSANRRALPAPGGGDGGARLALPSPPAANSDSRAGARVCVRVITLELALEFARVLLSDPAYTMKSAALFAGIKPSTVREAIRRYEHDECTNLADEEICEVLVKAREAHICQLRALGFDAAGKQNRAGTSWAQWQLEVQDQKEHPRKQQVELTGAEGGPVKTENESTVKYVVMVPEEEKEDDEESGT